jgi:hypothetical protein
MNFVFIVYRICDTCRACRLNVRVIHSPGSAVLLVVELLFTAVGLPCRLGAEATGVVVLQSNACTSVLDTLYCMLWKVLLTHPACPHWGCQGLREGVACQWVAYFQAVEDFLPPRASLHIFLIFYSPFSC